MLFGLYIVLFMCNFKKTFFVYSPDSLVSLVAFFPHEQVAYRFSTRFPSVYCESAMETLFSAHRNLCILNRDRIECADIFSSFFLKVNRLPPTCLFCHCRPYSRCKPMHEANVYRICKESTQSYWTEKGTGNSNG